MADRSALHSDLTWEQKTEQSTGGKRAHQKEENWAGHSAFQKAAQWADLKADHWVDHLAVPSVPLSVDRKVYLTVGHWVDQ